MNLTDYKIQGIGSFYGGEYDKVRIEGLCKLKDSLICNEFGVEGLLKSNGTITTKVFKCEGLCKLFENLKAEIVNIEGFLKARGALLEANEIACEGVLISDSEVSADKIVIDGSASIAFLVGDEIDITGYSSMNFGFGNIFSMLFSGRRFERNRALIDVIECTNLKAMNLKAKTIRAKNVTLEANCVIDYLEYSGELVYDEDDESFLIKKIVKV